MLLNLVDIGNQNASVISIHKSAVSKACHKKDKGRIIIIKRLLRLSAQLSTVCIAQNWVS